MFFYIIAGCLNSANVWYHLYFADVEKYYDPDLTIVDGSIDEGKGNQNIIFAQGNQQQIQGQVQFHQNIQNPNSTVPLYNPQNVLPTTQGVQQNSGIPPNNIQDSNKNPISNQPNQAPHSNNEDHKAPQNNSQQMNPNMMAPNQPYQQQFSQTQMYPNQPLTLPQIYQMQAQYMASQQMQSQQIAYYPAYPQSQVSPL